MPRTNVEDRLGGDAITGNMEYRKRRASFRILKNELIFKYVESFMYLWTFQVGSFVQLKIIKLLASYLTGFGYGWYCPINYVDLQFMCKNTNFCNLQYHIDFIIYASLGHDLQSIGSTSMESLILNHLLFSLVRYVHLCQPYPNLGVVMILFQVAVLFYVFLI